MHNILQKRVRFESYRYQLLHHVPERDKDIRYNLCCDFLSGIDDDKLFLPRVVFSDEATFHVFGNVNRSNPRIWGSENSHAVVGHTRGSPKLNGGPIFIAEPTVTGVIYLDMLDWNLMPILKEEGSHWYCCFKKTGQLGTSTFKP